MTEQWKMDAGCLNCGTNIPTVFKPRRIADNPCGTRLVDVEEFDMQADAYALQVLNPYKIRHSGYSETIHVIRGLELGWKYPGFEIPKNPSYALDAVCSRNLIEKSEARSPFDFPGSSGILEAEIRVPKESYPIVLKNLAEKLLPGSQLEEDLMVSMRHFSDIPLEIPAPKIIREEPVGAKIDKSGAVWY